MERLERNTGLVLEGGGMRGVFTSGVLDAFMKYEVNFPFIVSVSAGENELLATEIRNAEYGIICDSAELRPDRQRLYMERSVIHNCAGPGLLY